MAVKVIHVHLIYEKKNYYFGSISAIYDVLTAGGCKMTKRAMIIQSHLICSRKTT